MENQGNLVSLIYFIVVVISLIGFILPFLQKETLLFGSRMPYEIINHPELQKLKDNYKHVYLTIEAPFLILLLILLYSFGGAGIFIAAVFVQIILMTMIYIFYNRRAKELKKDLISREGITTGKETAIVDTAFRSGKYLISVVWFLPALIIIIANILILQINYGRIPERIGQRVDFNGVIIQTAGKTFLHVMMMPMTSLFVFLIFILVYYSIKRSKQDIDSRRPETSILREKHFRMIWSDFSVIVCTGIITWFLFLSLHLNGLLTIPAKVFGALNVIFPLLILISAVFLAVRTGQSGSRLKIKSSENPTDLNNVDDDKYWKMGMIYYNPGDPAIFVPKRFGVGWTINFGRPSAFAILIGIIAVSVILSALKGK